MNTLPTGTVTFLFTDIEGSTKLWEEHPRAMQVALARHDGIVRDSIEKHNGHVFKTVGDAFYAAFSLAADALHAALGCQRALDSVEWDTATPVKVRMALHTGAAEQREGDFFGPALNRVARLLSSGHGGQILLSLATQELVKDHLPSGVELRDLGAGGLRGLSRPEYIFQVVARGLPSEFRPLRIYDANLVESAGQDGQRASGEAASAGSLHANPYKGLRAFHEGDAADFFGRESLTARLLARLDEPHELCRFLIVVGPSGSGKSSAVRAGLVPALRVGKLPGSERWIIVEIIPGAHPLQELEVVLSKLSMKDKEGEREDEASGIDVGSRIASGQVDLEKVLQERDGLLRAAETILPDDERVELVLVVDQFEEVFTQLSDERERVHFLNLLYTAVTSPASKVRVIATLRADFYDRPLLYPNPAALVQQRAEVVVPLTAAELEAAITRPAARSGIKLEPGLVGAIIQDVDEEPGTLPLMQYALTELFERRQGDTMTLAAYRASGGVLGALTRRADELYDELSLEEQREARLLFLRLVTPGEGVEDTRRRVSLQELISAALDAGTLERLVELYGRHRLFTFDRDPVTHDPTVEVAHEALIRAWGRVREWLDESREELRVGRQLTVAAMEWVRSERDSSFLASGVRLSQFEALADREKEVTSEYLALTSVEREFIVASVQERDRISQLERQRHAKELELQKRSASRLRVLVVAMAVFLVIAVGLSLFAFDRQADANSQRKVAQNSAATAVRSEAEAKASFISSEARRLAAEAGTLLGGEGNYELIALLSIQSVRTQYSTQGDDALNSAAALSYPKGVFRGHTGRIVAVAFSPDGKFVMTGGDDNSARLWDVQTMSEVRRFSGHSNMVTGVAFSPDGKFIATSSDDRTVRLWDVQTGKSLRQFWGHSQWVSSIAYSSDGKYILTGSGDWTARLWEVQTGKQLRTFKGHTDRIFGVKFSLDGKYVLTGSADKTARLWDAETGAELRRFTGHTDIVTGVALSPDGRFAATSSDDQTAGMWDLASGTEVRRLSGHGRAVLNVGFSPDSKTMVTVGEDHTGRLWDTETGNPIHVLRSHIGYVRAAAFSPDGKYVLTGSDDSTAQLWETEPLPGLVQFLGHTEAVFTAVFSPDGRTVLTCGPDRTARLWDAQTGKEVLRFTGHTNIVVNCTFSPDGKYVLTGGFEEIVRLWDAQTGKEVRRFTGHGQSVQAVAFSPDGKYVLTAGKDKTARLSDVQTGFRVRDFVGHTAGVVTAAYSPDGKYVLTGSLDGTARLWDAQTGKEVHRFTGHTGGVGAAYSPEGKYVLTAGDDKSVRLWDAQTGKEVRRFTGHVQPVYSVAFSPDGKYILTASGDKTARLWHTDYNETVLYICSRLSRDFSDAEREQYGIRDTEPTCKAP